MVLRKEAVDGRSDIGRGTQPVFICALRAR
jgi:hypothetical protein